MTPDCPTDQMRQEMKGPWNQQAVLPAIVLIIPHKMAPVKCPSLGKASVVVILALSGQCVLGRELHTCTQGPGML